MIAATANPARTPIPKSKRPLPKSNWIGLRSKPEEKAAWDRLPFVGNDHHKNCSNWDVPLEGGFFGGIEVGRVAARLFIKYLRDQRDNPSRLGAVHLRGVLLALDTKQATTDEEQHSLNGQRTGFMNEIFDWLDAAALSLGSSFDAIPERSLVEQANESLKKTDVALMAAINARAAK